MKTMDSICPGQKKYRSTLTSNSFYQPHIPHSRSTTLRPQSEYGFTGIHYARGYSRGGGGGSSGSGGSAEWPPWGSPLGAPLAPPPRKKARPCSALLAIAALLAAMAVFAVAGLALYMGAFRADANEPIIAFEGRLRMRRSVGTGPLQNSIANPARLEAALRRACSAEMAAALLTIHVTNVDTDRLTAFFRIYLDRRKLQESNEDIENIIRNMLVDNSMIKNSALRQLNVDPASIYIKRDAEHTYKAELMNFSSTENKTLSSTMSQNTKDKVLQTRMGVIRKTGNPASLNSTLKVKQQPNHEEPDINVDELPVIQGSFQITKTEADITENKKVSQGTFKEPPKTTSRPSATPSKSSKFTVQTTTKAQTTKIHTSSTTPKTTTHKTTLSTKKTTTELPSVEPKINDAEKNKETDLPKLDTLFVVPSYIDQEPWRPIRPGEAFSTDNQNPDAIQQDIAEERIGTAEVIDDLTAMEGVPNGQTSMVHNLNNLNVKHDSNPQYTGINPLDGETITDYSPPIYTSFTDPAFSSTSKDTENLGSIYPVPHPIPVNKLVSIGDDDPVEHRKEEDEPMVPFENLFSTSTDEKSEEEAILIPNDKLSSVAINIDPYSSSNNTEFVNLHGGVIVKKHNDSNIEKGNHESEIQSDTKEFIKVTTIPHKNNEPPMLFSDITPMTWEFVNGTGSQLNHTKKIPNKLFNETLQAVITKNEDINDHTSNETDDRILKNVFSNISDIFDRLAESLSRPSIDDIAPAVDVSEKSSGHSDIQSTLQEETVPNGHSSIFAQGSSEPVDLSMHELLVKEATTEKVRSTVIIPTLLPVKSNSGIGRPLRPRPKPPSNDESRSLANEQTLLGEVNFFLNNLQKGNMMSLFNITNDSTNHFLGEGTEVINNNEEQTSTETTLTTSIKTNIVTSVSYNSKTKISNDAPSSESMKNNSNNYDRNRTATRQITEKVNINDKFRLPKTRPDDENEKQKQNVENSFGNDNKSFVLPTATEFFLTHPSTQAIMQTEKIKSIIRDLENKRNITIITPTIVAPIESDNDFISKNFTKPNNVRKNKTETDDRIYIKLRVEHSVSSSQDNKTKNDLTDEEVLSLINNLPQHKGSNATTINKNDSTLLNEKLKSLANIATITDSHNASYFNNERVPDERVISTKAISSSYTVNNAGFKILTKTFNKIPGNFKDDDKSKIKNHDDQYLMVDKDSDDCEKNNLTVKCSNGQCLPETARCNRLLDCPGGEDEKSCSCADYLKSQFLMRKICDGVLDCWDYSDENNCEWCSPNQYVCTNSRQCIDKDKVCDGSRDCPQGDDEKQCVTVATSQQDAAAFPYSKEGYIMIQKQGRWGRLCMQNFNKVIARSHSSLQMADLGRAVCRAMTYNDYQEIDQVREDSAEKEKNYFSLHYESKATSGKRGLAFRRSSCSKGQVAKVVCSNLQCGVRPQAAAQQASGGLVRHSRIVGGGNAGAGAWPWQAALYKEGDFQCGATLISDRWLISAGHCFYHAQEEYWVARLGALRRGTNFPSPYEQLQPISSIILHPAYIDSGFINDIALLKTTNKVAFSDYIRPICLPPAENEMDDNRRCTVIGWGQLFEVGRIFPDTLQEVELPVISTGECRKRTLFLPLYRITDDMFCAGFDRGGRDACLGDSGGPLMCQEQDSQWYLYGVTSNGYGCARANRPGVYTKVTNYVNWIQTTMQMYDDRSNDHPHNHLKNNRTQTQDLNISESRSFKTRHVDKCRGHRCPLGECLPPTRICNGFMECSDGSDEKDC